MKLIFVLALLSFEASASSVCIVNYVNTSRRVEGELVVKASYSVSCDNSNAERFDGTEEASVLKIFADRGYRIVAAMPGPKIYLQKD